MGLALAKKNEMTILSDAFLLLHVKQSTDYTTGIHRYIPS